MLGYFNFRKTGFGPEPDSYLITNDLGQYAFVGKEDLRALITGRMNTESSLGQKLAAEGFIYSESDLTFANTHVHEARSARPEIFSPTSLHIFVLTTNCNLACVYCQANSPIAHKRNFMSEDVARHAVDFALSSPSKHLSFEFQGGEPLLNFDTLRFIVEYTEARVQDRDVSFSVVTNLTLISDEIAEFLHTHHVSISTSLDGDALVHDANRPRRDGGQTFIDVVGKIDLLRSRGIGVGAIQTTTRASLSRAAELVDTYVSHGLKSLFVRPLTPLGHAGATWDTIGYTACEFVAFYSEIVDRLIKVNLDGIKIREGHAETFLSSIFGRPENYMELRSPCGAAFGQLAYTPNGDIFTCDEGRMLYEMGNESFRLGSVLTDSYRQVTSCPKACATCRASVLESLPGCCDCVYQPYCGVCPVVNLAIEGDLVSKEANGYRCQIYRGILDKLFALIATGDERVLHILRSWAGM